MSATTKIAVGVAAGYLLGRTKKMKLAITVGSMLAGQRIATNPTALMAQGNKLIDGNPELRRLKRQVTGRLMEAARDAAISTATSRVENMTRSLQAGPMELLDEDDEAEDYDEPEDLDEPDEDDEQDEDEQDSGPSRRSSSRGSSRASSRTAA
jgi:hypothetical protein